jgi:hypothetical protein
MKPINTLRAQNAVLLNVNPLQLSGNYVYLVL